MIAYCIAYVRRSQILPSPTSDAPTFSFHDVQGVLSIHRIPVRPTGRDMVRFRDNMAMDRDRVRIEIRRYENEPIA